MTGTWLFVHTGGADGGVAVLARPASAAGALALPIGANRLTTAVTRLVARSWSDHHIACLAGKSGLARAAASTCAVFMHALQLAAACTAVRGDRADRVCAGGSLVRSLARAAALAPIHQGISAVRPAAKLRRRLVDHHVLLCAASFDCGQWLGGIGANRCAAVPARPARIASASASKESVPDGSVSRAELRQR